MLVVGGSEGRTGAALLTARGAHRGHAVGDEWRLGHQAGAEAPFLHAVRRAAAVQVDLVVAEVIDREARAGGEGLRVGAAELQRQRVFGGVEAEVPGRVAVQDGAGRDHLGVQQHALRQQAREVTEVARRPVEHRRDRQAAGRGERVMRRAGSGRHAGAVARAPILLRCCGIRGGCERAGHHSSPSLPRLSPLSFASSSGCSISVCARQSAA